VTRKYPLDPLKRVRAEKVDQEARALSRALGQLEETRALAEKRELAKRELERSLGEVALAERERLEKGQLTAGDLARGAAFDIAGDMQRAAHARSLEQARTDQLRARTVAESKRGDLSSARAGAEVVEKHHQKWEKTRQAHAFAKDEESAEESHLARPRAAAPRPLGKERGSP
jgi:hypothetical protein